jgi:hypothetical protein
LPASKAAAVPVRASPDTCKAVDKAAGVRESREAVTFALGYVQVDS